MLQRLCKFLISPPNGEIYKFTTSARYKIGREREER